MKKVLKKLLSAFVFTFCLLVSLPSLTPKAYAQSSTSANLFDPKIDPGDKPIQLTPLEQNFISSLAKTVEITSPQKSTINPFPSLSKPKPTEEPKKVTPTPTQAITYAQKEVSAQVTPTAYATPPSVPVSTTPTQAPTGTAVPASATDTTSIQLNADKLFDMVNTYRASANLPAYQKEDRICKLADERVVEIYDEIWVTYSMHSGLRRRNLDYWVWENLIYQNTEEQALNWWINSPIHNKGLLSDMHYSCARCSGKSCVMLFTSFIPKQTN